MQRGVDGRPLGESALVRVAALDVRNGPHPAKERAHRTLLARLLQCPFYECFNACVAGKIPFDISPGLSLRNAQLRGKAECRNPVNDAKIDRLRPSTRHLVHGLGWNAKDFTSRKCMNINVFRVGLPQQRIAAEMRQQAQLNLRVVGREQLCPRRSSKCGPNLPAQLGADGNVLQIRVHRRQPSCRRCRRLERCMHPRLGIGQQR